MRSVFPVIHFAAFAFAAAFGCGNSFAAPHVAGLVARLLSKHPGLTPYDVKAVLRAVSRNRASSP